jgi:diadenosine hexaphosphate hydrolase (ATP-forming)
VVLGAGGVVFSPKGEVLLIRDGNGYWVLPKGHLDPGETPQQAALREVEEETGVKAQIRASLKPTHYVNNRGIAREIQWYLMKGQGRVRLERGLSGGGFFPLEEALRLLAFGVDVKLVEEAVAASKLPEARWL